MSIYGTNALRTQHVGHCASGWSSKYQQTHQPNASEKPTNPPRWARSQANSRSSAPETKTTFTSSGSFKVSCLSGSSWELTRASDAPFTDFTNLEVRAPRRSIFRASFSWPEESNLVILRHLGQNTSIWICQIKLKNTGYTNIVLHKYILYTLSDLLK